MGAGGSVGLVDGKRFGALGENANAVLVVVGDSLEISNTGALILVVGV